MFNIKPFRSHNGLLGRHGKQTFEGENELFDPHLIRVEDPHPHLAASGPLKVDLCDPLSCLTEEILRLCVGFGHRAVKQAVRDTAVQTCEDGLSRHDRSRHWEFALPKANSWNGSSAKMCPGFLLHRFWRIFPENFLEDFSGHFFRQK